MKKKNLSKLSLKKSTVSELNNSRKIIGGGEKSERRTNCELCPQTGTCANTCANCPSDGCPEPTEGIFCSLNVTCYILV
ncbi:class I lanthipeptide [Kordia algicida OT-1]|uniref:class I lanthipeptide n=1 Tax=Kordia algicida TaxID=221066 RepID=UPI00058E1FA3|nr:class I lanthipeptide [Kordia algicida]